MAREVIFLFLIQSLVIKVLTTSYAQPTLQQYLHLTGLPHSAHTITIPASQALPPNLATPTRPSTGLPSFSALALPNLVSSLQQLPSIQSPPLNTAASLPRAPSSVPQLPPTGQPNLVPKQPTKVDVKPSSIDSSVLNNLAIALQLLVVSNILNSPPPELSKPKVKETVSYTEQAQIPFYPPSMPNSKFVGTSSFAEPNVISTYAPTRNSMALMSPYEALGPSTTYSDSVLSPYASISSRQDFQSPYSMMGDNDLFAVGDLF
nr:proline-rich protein 36 [Helicoverpa armigera]